LWDCLPLLDEAVVESIKAMGSISAIAISHPHYYSCMVEWSRPSVACRSTSTPPTANG